MKDLTLIRTTAVLGAVCVVSACGDSTSGDAGTTTDVGTLGDGSVEVDGGSTTDAGAANDAFVAPMDAGSADDGSTNADAFAATDAFARADAGCVMIGASCENTCGFDPAAIEAALVGSPLVLRHVYCVDGYAYEPAVVSGGLEVRALARTQTGLVTNLRSITFSTSPTAPATAPFDIGSFTGLATDSIFPSNFLTRAVDGSTEVVIAGLTTSRADAYGVIFARTSTAMRTTHVAPGNYDALADGQYVYVNGLGVEPAMAGGQGIYRIDTAGTSTSGVKVLANIGAYSGSVGVVSDWNALIAGGSSATGSAIYIVSLDDLETAATSGTPVDAEVDNVRSFEAPSDFELLDVNDTRYLVSARRDASFALAGLDARIIGQGKGYYLEEPVSITTGSIFSGAVATRGDERFFLVLDDDGYGEAHGLVEVEFVAR